MEFIKRLKAPEKSNNYFYKDNAFQKYPMPNCTAYSWGRWYELLGEKHKLSTGNAENWFNNTKDGYKRGQTPKLGAVICWRKGQAGNSNDGAGHVAIVEEIKPDGTIITSNSAYKSTNFYTKTLKPPYSMGGSYVFQGFIYTPIEFTIEPPVKVEPVLRDTTKDQIKILRALNVRTGAGTNNKIVGMAYTGNLFNNLGTTATDTYTWYKIAENQYVAQNKDKTYLEELPKLLPEIPIEEPPVVEPPIETPKDDLLIKLLEALIKFLQSLFKK